VLKVFPTSISLSHYLPSPPHPQPLQPKHRMISTMHLSSYLAPGICLSLLTLASTTFAAPQSPGPKVYLPPTEPCNDRLANSDRALQCGTRLSEYTVSVSTHHFSPQHHLFRETYTDTLGIYSGCVGASMTTGVSTPFADPTVCATPASPAPVDRVLPLPQKPARKPG